MTTRCHSDSENESSYDDEALHHVSSKDGCIVRPTEYKPLLQTKQESASAEPIVIRKWPTIFLFRISVVLLIVTLIVFSYVSYTTHRNSTVNEETTKVGTLYDYIVVGGGPSGIIAAVNLAKRLLKEDRHGSSRVLLLESGTLSQSSVLASLQETKETASSSSNNNNNKNDNPLVSLGTSIMTSSALSTLNEFDIPLLWSGVAGREVTEDTFLCSHHWPVGRLLLARALGGCGVHNAMIYIRPLPSDFDRWNATGWTWENMLPYYRKLETYDDSMVGAGSTVAGQQVKRQWWRGYDGPIKTVPAGPAIDNIAPQFVESCLAAGIPKAPYGFNYPDAKQRIGAGYYEFNIDNGVRNSVAYGLLQSKDFPHNLDIITGATVSKVIMEKGKHDGRPPRAMGVVYFSQTYMETKTALLRQRQDFTHREREAEVILAAGALLTPQILSNSGIGPRGSVANVPGVGQNLQDHPVVSIAFRVTPQFAMETTSIYDVANEMEAYFSAVATLNNFDKECGHNESFVDAAGRLGTFGTAGFAAGAFLKSPWSDNESPDIQVTVFPRVIEPHVIRKNKDQSSGVGATEAAVLMTVALVQPEARHVVVPSTSEEKVDEKAHFELPHLELPQGHTQYLTERDVKQIAWGVDMLRQIKKMPPLVSTTMDEIIPGVDITGEQLENFVRTQHTANSHWAGSTKIGSKNDKDAVVDETLRVRGTRGVRIVDAGVFPFVPNGNTHSTVCAVALRAVDLIMNEH